MYHPLMLLGSIRRLGYSFSFSSANLKILIADIHWAIARPLKLLLTVCKIALSLVEHWTFLYMYLRKDGWLIFYLTGRRSRAAGDEYKSTKSPMTDSEFRNYLDSNGQLISERAFRESIYQGGIEPSLRKVTWRHLLNVYPPGMLNKS